MICVFYEPFTEPMMDLCAKVDYIKVCCNRHISAGCCFWDKDNLCIEGAIFAAMSTTATKLASSPQRPRQPE
jgi:hypothetical protein